MNSRKRTKLAAAAAAAVVVTMALLTPTAANAESRFPTGKQICPASQKVMLSFNYSNATANAYLFYGPNSDAWANSLQAVFGNGVYHYNTLLNPVWAGVRYSGNITWGKGCTGVSLMGS